MEEKQKIVLLYLSTLPNPMTVTVQQIWKELETADRGELGGQTFLKNTLEILRKKGGKVENGNPVNQHGKAEQTWRITKSGRVFLQPAPATSIEPSQNEQQFLFEELQKIFQYQSAESIVAGIKILKQNDDLLEAILESLDMPDNDPIDVMLKITELQKTNQEIIDNLFNFAKPENRWAFDPICEIKRLKEHVTGTYDIYDLLTDKAPPENQDNPTQYRITFILSEISRLLKIEQKYNAARETTQALTDRVAEFDTNNPPQAPGANPITLNYNDPFEAALIEAVAQHRKTSFQANIIQTLDSNNYLTECLDTLRIYETAPTVPFEHSEKFHVVRDLLEKLNEAA